MKYWRTASTLGFEYARTDRAQAVNPDVPDGSYAEYLEVETGNWVRDDRLYDEIYGPDTWSSCPADEALAEADRLKSVTV